MTPPWLTRPLLTRRRLIAAAPLAALACPTILRAQAAPPLRIGEINSYSTAPADTEPYRLGWQLAVKQVNDLGGVNGRQLEVISRDDAGSPDQAVQLAADLLDTQKVDLLAGGLSGKVALALSQFALGRKALYVAGEPLSDALVWENGNRYTYRVRPSTFMLVAMLVEAAAIMPAKTWVTVAPDNDDGRSAVRWFRQLLSGKRADVRFVGEQWPVPGQVDGAAVAGALNQPAPDAVFNALLGADLLALLRSGSAETPFGKRPVVSLLTGDPENLAPLGSQVPAGWTVTGYPWDVSDDPYNKQFVFNYLEQYHQNPTVGSAIGAAMISAIASGVRKSGSTSSEAMADGFGDTSFVTAFGICQFRAIDHQSTMGSYVGQLAKVGEHGVMVDWRYVDGGSVLPPDDLVHKLRPG